MLKHPLPGGVRFATGVSFALLLSLSTGYVAWASQPAQIQERAPVAAASAAREVVERLDDRRHKPPRYPQDAIDRGVSGSVVLIVDVGADGLPLQAELSPERSSPQVDASLVASARDAVMQWRFEPARDENGKPKAGSVLVPITFDVDRKADPEPTARAAPNPTPSPSANPLPVPVPRTGAQQAPGPVPTYNAIKPPRYPVAAIQERRSGTVMLRVLVGSDGRLQQVEVETSSGSPDLDEAAIAAVRDWRFNPAHDGYKAVPAWIGVPVNFSLDESPTMRASADSISLNPQNGSVAMAGNVDAEQGGLRLRGEHGSYDASSRRLEVSDTPTPDAGQHNLDGIGVRAR